jgi:hypothetical protein
MTQYFFYSRIDKNLEPIYYCKAKSRLQAAKIFAQGKQLPLKTFLSLYGVSK